MKWIPIAALGLFCLGYFGAAASAQVDERPFFVSTDGNDSWSGGIASVNAEKSDGPFATLERARDAIRQLKRENRLPEMRITVCLRGGDYYRDQSFELTAEDSGSAKFPITYKPFNHETVRIIGGQEIEGIQPVQDGAVRLRLKPEVQEKVVVADLKLNGIADFGELTPRGFGRSDQPAALELFWEDEPMTLARYPNEGEWLTVADAPDGSDGGKFTYSDERPKQWKESGDIWTHGYWTWDWADSYVHAAKLNAENGVIHTSEPHGVYGYKKGQRFYFLNVLEELDQRGEWYLDRENGKLYFYPPEPLGHKRIFASMLEEPLVTMENASFIRFESLIFEVTRGEGLTIRGGEQDQINGCTIRNTGNNGISITGGSGHGVQSCDIYNTGDSGIALSGGDRNTLTAANHYADNNHIHHFSRWVRTYRPAVLLSGVGNRVSHNLIHDSPHTGVLFSGNDHVLEYNEVHHICRETGDVGAFYIGRDWTMRGNVVRHNFFHHITGPYTHGAMGVYLDDCASGTTIYGNVFYRASRAAFIGGGRDNTVENNIFVECEPSVHVDARGLTWAKEYIQPDGGWHIYKKLEEMDYQQPPYSEKYPELVNIINNNPHAPVGNRVLRNISVGGKWLDLQNVDEKDVEFKDNLVDRDPHFIDAENLDFRLKEDSPAYLLGFKPIPVEQIGLQDDEYRTLK